MHKKQNGTDMYRQMVLGCAVGYVSGYVVRRYFGATLI